MTWEITPPGAHTPVMLREVMETLAPQPGETIVDGTFGGGGYTRAILAAGAAVIAIDRDPAAIARAATLATEMQGLTVAEGRFGALDDLARAAGHDKVDGIVLDIGVSSFQFDEADRGFSFRFDAPLDMRMGGEGPSAADFVNHADESGLAHLFRTYGEERRAGALARAIVADRPFHTTLELASLCERVIRASRDGIHPATRAFQALRIAVNDELAELASALRAAQEILREGGRLVVVSFHSLEDRIVKRFLADRTKVQAGSRHAPVANPAEPPFSSLTRKALLPAEDETRVNPRARSAKLRAALRTGAPSIPLDPATLVPAVRLKGVPS
ncbi:16S rRNA (cytosine(1402)-N(4))-methyltransferase RsmH [Acuticoccus sp. MNP-M23]|uniref:16S rRNA (cytosine(1402)-N(4))-methyltransferase RsmH n=1 Tax=Acuticoccus sp. MNP-M23 TaxID=3072793 RepID=UPI002814AE8A|nr:16S rRNA (cytosine(1402)-N(4))-methyltransferase RsmH [Acuticoccus sp. MNP-M23]WMS40846.1 16S rRNA (cytosine(1402)-N(4))-methyltransferase RsmH [Acuticoccus sp. MNP-M23]